MRATDFLDALSQGLDSSTHYFSVPCSVLAPILMQLPRMPSKQGELITCSNEGEAVAAAFGAMAGGDSAVVLMQNSGLGNALNPLTSLVRTFSAVLTMIIGYRGAPNDSKDEPQHRLMGSITAPLLARIGYEQLEIDQNTTVESFGDWLERTEGMNRVVLVHPEAITPVSVGSTTTPIDRAKPSGEDVVERTLSVLSSPSIVVATTGYTARDALAHRQEHHALFPMVGSMGCAPSIALGAAIQEAQADSPRRIVVLDGDGALAMRLESLIGIGHNLPTGIRLDHVLINNSQHESTGGQPTLSEKTDFPRIASACGYSRSFETDLEGLSQELSDQSPSPGAHFLSIQCTQRSQPLSPRPTGSPEDSLHAYKQVLSNDASDHYE